MKIFAVIGFIIVSFFESVEIKKNDYKNVVQNDTTQINQLLDQAQSNIDSGDFSTARSFIHQADSLSIAINYEEGRSQSASYIADILITEQQFDSALTVLQNALRDYPESNHKAQMYNLMGTIYEYKSEWAKAIQYFEAALDEISKMEASNSEKDRMTAGMLQNLAVVYQNMGEKAKALENYLEAIEYAEAARDTSFLTIIYNNVGLAYNDEEEYERAVFYLEKALNLAEAKNLKADIYRATLNLANSRTNQENYEEAMALYDKAEALHNEFRPNAPPVIILHNKGKLYGKMGLYAEAEELLRESLSYSMEMNIQEGIYHNYFVLGNVYYEQERFEEAINYFSNAKDIADDLGSTSFMEDSRENLYETYAKAGRFQEAYDVLKNYKAMTDSLADIEKEKELAELENQLELNRQNEINQLLLDKQTEQEQRLQFQLILIIAAALIIILILAILYMMRKSAREKDATNTLIREKNEELEELNRAKDKLFAIIAHDLRSPLTSMQGILYLIKNRSLSKNEIEELAQELEVTVQQNLDVMEDLLAWAQEQLSGVEMDIQPVNLKEIVDQVLGSQSFLIEKKGLTTRNMLPGNTQIIADKNALQLVIRNLISNSIKYTNSGDEILVASEPDPDSGYAVFTIKDTGIGIPNDAKSKIFDAKMWTREGTNKEKGTGFGLNLSNEFIKRMNGEIWFESEEGEGTTFFIKLPEA